MYLSKCEKDNFLNPLDILQKLLPFTHSENGSVNWVVGMDLGDWLITVVICILFGLSFWWGLKLWRSYKIDKQKIDFLLDTLNEYKDRMQAHYGDFCEKLKTFDDKGELHSLWNEFDESLIKTTNHFTGVTTYRNSIDAEHFFHKKNLLTHIGSKFYATVPSILLGIGLIGTFLGLFVGLVQLNIDNADTLKDSMKALIHAAGVKFASSIWGLALSLGFTVFDKRWEQGLENKIEQIHELINYTFERRTAEQSLEDIFVNSGEQRDALNGLAGTLTNVIIETQAKSDGVLGERLDRLANILENFATKSADTNSAALENTIKAFMDGLKEAGANQGKELAEIMSKTTDKLGSLVDVIEMTARLQDERNEKLRNDIADIKDAQAKMLQEMGKTIMDGAKSASDSLEAAGTQLANSQNEVLNKLIAATEAFGRAPQTLEKVFEQIKTHAVTVELSMDGIAHGLQNTPKYIEQFGTSASMLENFGSKMEGVAGGLDKFAKSIEIYRQTVENIGKNLQEVANSSKDTAKESSKVYENIALQYDNLLNKNKQSIEEFAKSVKTYLDEYHHNTQTAMQGTFGEFDSKLKSFAETLASAISELNDAVSELADRTKR